MSRPTSFWLMRLFGEPLQSVMRGEATSGVGYLEEAFRWKEVRLEVVEPLKAQTPGEELVADVLSIVTVFSGRLYGSRAKKVRSSVAKALKECLKAEEADGTDGPNHETPAGSR